jgi:hypothetical protein
MTQSRKQMWVEVTLVTLALAAGGLMLYALLPMISAPDQQVVPPPPSMNVNQILLILFITATAGGAPLVIGWVLMQIFKFASKRVPATSSAAPEIPSPKPKTRSAEEPKDMSPREALMWKIVATVLLLIIGTGALVLLASAFTQFYH